ncbi:MAG: adenylate/guanylate cyclase domain-containing protein [Burkholderiaceae bacterium]|nr:adenylate/guanylate cyclase domain-containing protein [Burkholderiaceae bacterium]
MQQLRRHGVFLGGLALAGLTLLALQLLVGPWLSALEERTGDWAWALTAERTQERRLVVVDIDERSLSELGPWPWQRSTLARLLEQLARLGARQQILDIVFADTRPDDAHLARTLVQYQPVLAQVFALEQGGTPSVGKLAGALSWPTCPAPFGQAQGYLASVPSVLPDASGPPLMAGHITPRIASDGVMRHQPAIICMGSRAYPALALAALMQAGQDTHLTLERGHWLQAPWLLSGNAVLGTVPLNDRGDFRIPWRLHPDSFISLSASDVIAGRVPPQLVAGAWVLVGSSAFGLNDTIATPFGGAASGLQAHAQTITALLDGRMSVTPRAAPWLQALAALCALALLYALVPPVATTATATPEPARLATRLQRLPPYLLPLAGVGLALLLWLLHGLLQALAGVWLGWTAPVLFTVLAGIYIGVLEHARSRIDRDRLYAHLSSYLPAPVAAALALQRPSSAIEAQTRQVSVLFADIRNFSAYCEARPPEESAAVLHAFFAAATRVVQAHGGVIEAFQGDAIIAVWNGELHHSASALRTHHALQALHAAIDLLHAVQGVLPDPAPAGLEPLSLGVGVETGPAMAGSFGLASRRTHMVMGRTVTIASRLVQMTADLSHPILVGEGLAAQVGGVGLESLGTFLLDGMRVPHHIYAHPLDAAAHSH